MTQQLFAWLLLLLAAFAANLPFFTPRFLGVYKLGNPKPPSLQCFEMLLGYLLVGVAGLFFEQHLGQIAPQDWQFYVVTGVLFITLAFPGFVYRYLLAD